MKVQTGDVFLFCGEPFIVRAGIEIDEDGEVQIPISWMSNSLLVEMHAASSLAISIATGDLVRCFHDKVASSKFGGRVCAVCGLSLRGWYCPDNSDGHRCEYDDDESCVFCGQPEERK